MRTVFNVKIKKNQVSIIEKIIAKINRRMKNNFLLGTKPKSIQKKFSLTNN